MISKKLLDVVYPTDEIQECYVDIQESTGRVMWFGKKYKDCRSEIDIHRVAHKCKEWASTHNYSVISGWEMTHWGGAYRVEVFRNSNNILFSMSTVDTEPEAIFKASEWILEQTQNKKDYK